MANKARPPMTKPEEVIAWAEETKARNGESFTMLKKEEQLLIAKFIIAMRDHIKKLQSSTGESAKGEPPAAPQENSISEETEGTALGTDGTVVGDDPTSCCRQTNIEYFKANNVPMSRAYELYCVWRNCDPENRTVFDHERKAWLKAAGFAFWLNLPHE